MSQISSSVESAQVACTKINNFAETLRTDIMNKVNTFVNNDLADWQGQAKTAFANQCQQVFPKNLDLFLDGNLKVLGTNAVKAAQLQSESDSQVARQINQG